MSQDSPFVEFSAGSTILREGEPARAMFIIEAGRVEIRRGGTALVELGPGDIFGETAILAEQPHGADAVAATAVRALAIDQAEFHALLGESAEVSVALMRRLVARLAKSEQRAGRARPAAPERPAQPAPAPAAKPEPKAEPRAEPKAAPKAEPKAEPTVEPKAAPKPEAKPPPAAAPAQPPSAPAPEPAAPAARTPAAPPVVKTAAPGPPAPARPAPQAAAPPAPPAALDPTAMVLRHAQAQFTLAPGRTDWLVGRPDPATGQVPEINLGDLDTARSLSRRHARLKLAEGSLWLVEEPNVANGTWVNGNRLTGGQPVAVGPGDKLRFGAIELELTSA